jgi:Predicted metal-dependent protease of the PAD1/JAB1 superfamily
MEVAAKAAYPGECCGILLGKTGENGEIEVLETREAPNLIQGTQKSAHFRIDPLFLYQVEREIEGNGIEVIGFYHSHPDCAAVPSDEDYDNMVPGLVYVILSVTKDGVKDTRSYKKDTNY